MMSSLFEADRPKVQLRPYQADASEAILEARERGVERGLVVMPTGTGKTTLFAHLAGQARSWDRPRSLILAHREELLDQAARRIAHQNHGLEVAIEAGDRKAPWSSDCVVAGVATIGRANSERLSWLNPGLTVCDEAHHAPADSYMNVFRRMGCWGGDSFLLGVTATPHRLDNKPLHGDERAIFDEVLYTYTLRDAIRDGWLCDVRGYRVATDLDLSKVKTQMGDFNAGELAELVNNEARNEKALEHWREVAEDRRTIIFCADVEHAHAVAALWRERGFSAAAVDGRMDMETRSQIIHRFRTGEIQVLANVQIATEGFDCLDDQTEILTESGWKGIGEIDQSERVYSLNRDLEMLELVPITRYVERELRPGERMVRFESQHLNIRVTEGHEIHIKQRSRGPCRDKWYTKTAGELVQRKGEFRLPLAAPIEQAGLGLPVTPDDLRLVGWALTDGWLDEKRGRLEIYQSESKHHERIRALLDRMGLDFSERMLTPDRRKTGYRSDHNSYTFSIPKGSHSGSMARNGWWHLLELLDKSMTKHDDLHILNRDQFKILWDEMMLANGARKAGSSGWLWMPKKHQADVLTMLAAKHGFACSCAEEKTASGNTVWRISIREKRWISTYPNDPRSTRIKFDEVRPGERVWCVTNRNSTLVTRRGGKVAIIGNCPEIACVLMLRPTQSWALYTQMVGRGLRILDGKEDCIVVDVVDNSARHNLATVPGLLGLPTNLDLQGHKLQEAVEKIESLGEDVQAALFRRPTRFEDISTELQEIDLLAELSIPEALATVTRLSWVQVGDGKFVLNCGTTETERFREMKMKVDTLGRWTAVANSSTRNVGFQAGTDPAEAFRKADDWVRKTWPDAMAIVNEDSAWKKQPATDKQKALLKSLGVSEVVIAACDKGTASRLISKQMMVRTEGKHGRRN